MAKEKRIKVETDEQKAIRKQKEAKELAKLEKEKAKPKWSGYLAYFIFIVAVVYLVDEVTSQLGSYMQTIIAQALITPLTGNAENASTVLGYIGYITYFSSALAFIYKPLSDRYGRKPFLIINTLGMGLGMFLVGSSGVASSLPLYIVGTVAISFFIPHDMQAIYIQECAPAKYRGTVYSVIKSLATMGMFIVALLMDVFIKEDDFSQWPMVYIIPSVLAFVIAVLAIFFMRESDVFIDHRISLLKMSDEEREESLKKGEDSSNKIGIFSALKFCFKNKQMLWLLVSGGFLMWGMYVGSDYSTILSYGYAKADIANGMAVQDALIKATNYYVNDCLKMFAVGSALCQLFPGFISDKIGRKKAMLLTESLSIVFFLLYFFGCNLGWNPFIVGLCCGSTVGCYIAAFDLNGLMVSESAPTNLRVSVMTVQPIVCGTIYAVSIVAQLVAKIMINNDASLGWINFSIAVPGAVIGLVLMMIFAKDTKGVDLNSDTTSRFEQM